MKPFDITSEIVNQQRISKDVFKLSLSAQSIAQHAIPGQFCMIQARTESSKDPLLKRPFSINAVTEDTITILYRVVGRGTKYLSNCSPKEQLNIIGPLGNGFSVAPVSQHILVAGGMGIAPISFLATYIHKKYGQKPVIINGAACQTDLLETDRLSSLGCQLYVATEDGSTGHKGLVTDILKPQVSSKPKDVQVYACGPYPMLKAVSNICQQHDVPLQVSMEAMMACGIGLCLGCVIDASNGGYLHVCKEGPVFNSEDINWK